MGYILPITHYDYKQYQNRMNELEESPHYIDRPYRAVFHRISPEFDGNEKEMSQTDDAFNKGERTDKQRQLDFYYISKFKKAQLTGKGGTINEQT